LTLFPYTTLFRSAMPTLLSIAAFFSSVVVTVNPVLGFAL